MHYAITLAAADDLPYLPEVEARASDLFDGNEITARLPLINSDMAEFEHAHAAGLLWVARDVSGKPVGFAMCEQLGPDLHIEELDVHPAHGRRGVGKDLVMEVCRFAAERDRDVTLTTFRDLPWNQPFYEKLGFREVSGDEISSELARRVHDEEIAGLPREIRIAMRRPRATAST